MVTQDTKNMNSLIAINNTRPVVKNLATKVTPTRLETSLKNRPITYCRSHGVRRNSKRGREKREKRRESGKEIKTSS